MDYVTNDKGNLQVKFTSNINIDNGLTNISQGDMRSEMELFQDGDKAPRMIEWCVYNKNNDYEFVEHIGLWFDGKTLVDYDGVFELPKEAIKLIRKSGYSVPKHFED